jgi:hypothetical protein
MEQNLSKNNKRDLDYVNYQKQTFKTSFQL